MPPIEPPPAVIPAGSVPISSLAAIASPRLLGRDTGGAGPVKELQPVESLAALYTRGANLLDANQTIQPFTDRAYLYVATAGLYTANRELTLGNTGLTTAFANAGAVGLLLVARLGSEAFTLTVRRTDATIILVDPASPPIPRLIQFVCSPVGVWAPSAIYMLKSA